MKITCPKCKRITTWEENPFRPFCSERCKLIDLGAWTSGEYAIPMYSTGETNQAEPSEEENE